MPDSPKRKSEIYTDNNDDNNTKVLSKKVCLTPKQEADSPAAEVPVLNPNAAPDSHIDHAAAIAYWSSTEPTVNGVLGGYPQVSRVDLQGSANFLAKLRRQSKRFPPGEKLQSVVDCGAGIGRITDGFLTKVTEIVDIVEPVKSFTDQIKAKNVGRIYNVGLEAWDPANEGVAPYDLIWIQWCVGQLTDLQLVDLLKRLQPVLSRSGWIMVKENLSNHHLGEDVYDDTDSSVTRTDTKFRMLFDKAGLKVVSTEPQRGMPKGLYPVRAYALQPR